MSIRKWNAASIYCKAGILIGTVLILIGCAGQPPAALEEARQNLNRAKQDQNIVNHAPVALYDAEQTVQKASSAWEDEGNEEYVEHMAYLANQQIKIAEANAQQKAAQTEFEKLSGESQQLRLAARTKELADKSKELEALRGQKTERGTLITMGDVLFRTGQANLKPGALQNLYRLSSFLKENPNRKIIIEGHTDSVGSNQTNQALSERRAHAVADFLIANGIEGARITDVGYGENYPIAPNNTLSGRQLNRRVEITVLNEGEEPRLRR